MPAAPRRAQDEWRGEGYQASGEPKRRTAPSNHPETGKKRLLAKTLAGARDSN